MIVAKAPHIGHAFREILIPLLLLFVWDVAVTLLYYHVTPDIRPIELPLPLFGSALALFLSMRDNAAYARWWEARGLWGLMINASRSVARQAVTLVGEDGAQTRSGLSAQIVRAQIAYVHALRTALRGEAAPDLVAYLTPEMQAGLAAAVNKPNFILTAMGQLAGEAARRGLVDPFARVRIEDTLVDIANAQGGMERIKNTPMPAQYVFFPTFFTRLFCVVLPFAIVQDLGIYTPVGSTFVGLMLLILLQIGDDLKDPFANDIHAVPLAAMCNTIETDLKQMIGLEPPAKVQPQKGVLW